GQGGLLHVARQREVPAAGGARRPDPIRARHAPVPRQDLQDERRRLCGRAGGGGGGDDGLGGRSVIHRTALVDPTAHLAGDVTVGPYAIIGPRVTVSERCQISAHAVLEDLAITSGMVPIHQFVRIGTFAVVGGGSRVNQDVPPYTKAVGNPVHLYGLNSVGLQRAGFSPEVKLALKRAYRLL